MKATTKKSTYLPKQATTFMFILFLFVFIGKGWAQTQSQAYTSSGVFVPGEGITSVVVECWGGGGKGGSRTSSGAGGGAGGGAYSRSVIGVVPGTSYIVTVGAGSTTTLSGGDSWFGSLSTILAKGGNSVANNSSSGASGGSAQSGIGEIKFSGGNGANGHHGSGLDYGGGGGSSAGIGENGNGGNFQYGGIAPDGGGNGGDGKEGTNASSSRESGPGSDGSTPGGGGGGALRIGTGSPYSGGNGANGQVIISWNSSPEIVVQPVNSNISYGDVASFTVVAACGYNYHWEEYITSWVPLSDSGIYSDVLTPSLNISKAAVNMSGNKYRCLVTNANGTSVYTDGNAVLMVTPKELTVIANSYQYKYYGQVDPEFTFIANGFVNGEDESDLDGALSREAGEESGIFPINIGSLEGANYSIIFTSADFEIKPSYKLSLTVFLQSCYNVESGTMNTTLNSTLPAGQPFVGLPWNYSGSETLPNPLSTEVVDWVLVELRSDENTIFERKAGLLYNNGSVQVRFSGSSVDGNYVVVWHSNHMPVMSAEKIMLPIEGASYDLSASQNLFGIKPAIDLGGSVYGMIAGDVNHDGVLKYSGSGNDRGPILATIIQVNGSNNMNNTTPSGYWLEDVSMNSIVSYLGSSNDRSLILANLGYLTGTPYLNNTYFSVVPGVYNGGGKEGSNIGPIDIHFNESVQQVALEIETKDVIADAIIDNIQFTLAWNEGDTEIELVLSNFTSDFNLVPQGEVTEVDGVNYQTFASTTPTVLPAQWNPGDVMTVITFTKEYGLSIGSRLWIAENEVSSENNGEYYVSNLGTDFTGMVLTTMTGIEESNTSSLNLYPNPVTGGSLNIHLNTPVNGTLETEVWNMTGKLIMTREETMGFGIMTYSLDISNLDPGMYILQVRGGDVEYSDRFIVK
jgi:hypothetical protein